MTPRAARPAAKPSTSGDGRLTIGTLLEMEDELAMIFLREVDLVERKVVEGENPPIMKVLKRRPK